MLDWTQPGKKFEEMALEHGRLAGYKGDGFPVINRKDHPQEWRDWYSYYGFRNLPASQEMMRSKDEKTVPTRSPFDFDAEFNPRYPSPEVPREGGGKAQPITPEARARVAALHAAFNGRIIGERPEESEAA